MLGDRKDSALYVRTKRIACEKTGIRSVNFLFPEAADQRVVMDQIDALNGDPTIDGILVQVRPTQSIGTLCLSTDYHTRLQLPLPSHIDAQRVIDHILPTKDVDGLHPFNVGELAMRHRYPYLVPCTAKGIIAMLDAEGVELEGKTAVVLGRSNLVGNPVSLLLQKRNATVVQCHSKTRDLPKYVAQADVLVVACGQPYLVRGEWLKPGAIVVDVGINFVQEDDEQAVYHGDANADGFKIVGDVHFGEAQRVAGAITPVPGGVGPMTIAMLLHNVVAAYKRHVGNES
jgi:5,10-methylene-tetrahydrofolate dehydrogenase/methenyl tetrahydrofolate cyclohydrolase